MRFRLCKMCASSKQMRALAIYAEVGRVSDLPLPITYSYSRSGLPKKIARCAQLVTSSITAHD
jgi:hypothetical protein